MLFRSVLLSEKEDNVLLSEKEDNVLFTEMPPERNRSKETAREINLEKKKEETKSIDVTINYVTKQRGKERKKIDQRNVENNDVLGSYNFSEVGCENSLGDSENDYNTANDEDRDAIE